MKRAISSSGAAILWQRSKSHSTKSAGTQAVNRASLLLDLCLIFLYLYVTETVISYWNWSLDVSSDNTSSTAVYSSSVFDAEIGFGGNGYFVESNSTTRPLNLTGRLGGGCVMDVPFTQDQLHGQRA
jgi:hypothetical protein